MSYSLIFGTAFEVEADYPDGPNYRLYRADGHTFMGRDTLEIAHTCSHACTAEVLHRQEVAYVECQDGDAYVRFEPTDARYLLGVRWPDEFPTIDVVDFDRGDDPYVVCEVCGTVLYRDDEAFEAMFGRPIRETS